MIAVRADVALRKALLLAFLYLRRWGYLPRS